MPIVTFPKFAGTGRTASMMDEEMLLLGNDDLGSKGRYISIQKPRDGVLGIKYTVEKLPLTQSPHQHSSLVSKNTLTVVGGKFKSRGKFSKFTWTELSLKWENGSKYLPAFIDACTVKQGVDVHIIFGGEKTVYGRRLSVRDVVKINTTEEIAYELKPMTHRRVSHDCQILNPSLVLVSGGLPHSGGDPSEVLQDELYNITSEEVVKVLDLEQSLRRAQHATIRIGGKVLAFGGRDSTNAVPSRIAEFNKTSNSWEDLSQELHSSNTSELVVTPFPISSIDCAPQCQCGTAKDKERIFGGNEAKVRNTNFAFNHPVFRLTPTLGLLRF